MFALFPLGEGRITLGHANGKLQDNPYQKGPKSFNIQKIKSGVALFSGAWAVDTVNMTYGGKDCSNQVGNYTDDRGNVRSV